MLGQKYTAKAPAGLSRSAGRCMFAVELVPIVMVSASLVTCSFRGVEVNEAGSK